MSSLIKIKAIPALCAGLLLLVSGCGTIQPEVPTTANQVVAVKPMPSVASTINIPIRVELKPFIKLADQSFDKEFKGSDNPCSGLRYQYKLEREPIQLSGKGKTVYYTCYASVRVTTSTGAAVASPTLSFTWSAAVGTANYPYSST
ncbi:MAG: DUF4403 family protein, partial [Bacteroidota bacterium]